MPPKKKQRTGASTRASSNRPQEPDQDEPKRKQSKTSNAPENPERRDPEKIPDFEYICVPRPFYDFEAENENRKSTDKLEKDELFSEYAKAANEVIKRHFQPAADRPDWKWVIMWKGYKSSHMYSLRAKYCDPDNFDMYIYNDFHGYGLVELVENTVLDFEKALKEKGDDALKTIWASMTALRTFICTYDMMPFTMVDDGDKINELCKLVGYTLLRALAALDHAGELKADSEFVDIPITVTSMLDWSHGWESSGIEEGLEWRSHAKAYFAKGKFDASKGTSNTEKLLKKDQASSEKTISAQKDAKDPWGWNKMLKDYKTRHERVGGRHFDITKFTREERASYAFDKVDPLKDIPIKVLKEDGIDLQ